MKNKSILLGILLSASIFMTGCTGALPTEQITYSNLNEESIRYDLNSLLQSAKVPDAARAQLFSHVDQFNAVMSDSQLTEGFEIFGSPKYDPYDVQDAWMETYPDFLGYNCRITAFSLFKENLQIPSDAGPSSTEMLEFDLDALNTDASAFPGGERQFLSFFAPVYTEPTKDTAVHARKVQEAWRDRGISFRKNDQISMINMYFHYQDGDRNLLYAGHSGILLPTPDGDLWFVEKLAFMEPYQVVKLRNRHQLQDYLMEKYDLDQNQPTAKPFILENADLMKA